MSFIKSAKMFVQRELDRKRQPKKHRRERLRLETLETRKLLTTAILDGDWFDPNIWDDGIPTAESRAIIGHGITVALDGADHVAKELVVHGDLVVQEDASVPNKSLETRWIHVNSGGQFVVGTEDNRYDEGTFRIVLTGTDVYADYVIETNMGGTMPDTMTVQDNDGFLMTAMQGRIQFYGEDKLSFTKLAETAVAGASSIQVENVIERNFVKGAMIGDDFVTSKEDDGALNWEVGDQIVIASSSYDYTEQEVRVITAITDNGDGTSSLTLDAPLSYRHYGAIETYGTTAAEGTEAASRIYEMDMRAEVALLSRNIKVQGLESQDTDYQFGDRANLVTTDRIPANGLSSTEIQKLPTEQVANGVGGHIMIMPQSGQITVDGVQLDRMGQASQKGRYPIHWHLGDDRSGDLLRNSSVTNSNNRGVTIHGTSNLQIEGVVLHDIHGHGFFFEDAVETGNELVANLALGIHTVGGHDKDFANPGTKDPFVVDTHDSVTESGARFKSSAAYWITNPNNTFVGNIAAGAGDQRDTNYANPGPDGTGFWFAIPRTALGPSGEKPIYADVTPIFAEFGQFHHNTSHTMAVGLNFDRGEDIEDADFDASSTNLNAIHGANQYSPRIGSVKSGPSTTNYINGFTNYKSVGAAVYHRGQAETIRYNDLRIADSYNGPWAVSETEFNNSLYVGHSRGNADLTASVGGPRLYDGSGLHSEIHFAGFAADNAFTFQVEGSSFGPTMYHALRDVSFEDDGTYDHLAHAVSDFQRDPSLGHDLGQPARWIKAVMDLDGSLTAGAGGGAGFSIVPNIDFLAEAGDTQPAGWDAWLTDDIYARIKIENNNDGSDRELFPSSSREPVVRFTARDGDSIDVMGGQNNGNHSWVQVVAKTDGDGYVDGTFTVEFGKSGLPTGGFVLNMRNQDGNRPQLNPEIQAKVDAARIVVKLVGAGNYTPNVGTEVSSETALRSIDSGIAYYRDDSGNLFFNTGITDSQPLIRLTPGDPLQTPFVARVANYGAIVQAEAFDYGVDGIAYHDSDASNTLSVYRSDTGVDASESYVGNLADGEWMEYTTGIVATGYNIGVDVASTVAGGQIRVLAAISNSAGYLRDLGTIDVPNTGGQFTTQWLESIDLTFAISQQSVIRLEFLGDFAGDAKVDSIRFAEATQSSYVDGGRTIAANATASLIQFEEYDRGGQGVAYFDDTPGNDNNGDFREDEDVDANDTQVAGKVFDGEWLEYTTDIESGVYDITLLKKWGGAGSGVKLLIGESNAATEFTELGAFLFPDGTNNDAITLENVDLTSWGGLDRVIRPEIIGNWMGLDYLRFDHVSSVQTPYVHRTITPAASLQIKLSEYDNGGHAIAYSDTSNGNNAGNFRVSENVDSNGNIITNHVMNGEWLEYTTDIQAGLYNVTLKKAWSAGDAGMKLLIADSHLATEFTELGVFQFDSTADTDYTTLTDINLDPWAGSDRVIRVEVVGNWMGLDFLNFSAASSDTVPPTAEFVNVTPDPRNTSVGVVTIRFDEDVTGFDISDLALTRDGDRFDISHLAVHQVTPSQYEIDLSPVTNTDGNYELKLNGAGSEIQDMEGNLLAHDAVDQFVIDMTAANVESVVINDGSAQRSMVRSLTITFSEVVGGVDDSSFILMNTTTNTQVVPNVATKILDGKTVATLTFSGSGIASGSLADGNYRLITLAKTITDAAGNSLDGNGDGIQGDNATDQFFRYFGDIDGDRDVDARDYWHFRKSYCSIAGDSEFNDLFDFDGDGDIDSRDFSQFRSRYRTRLAN